MLWVSLCKSITESIMTLSKQSRLVMQKVLQSGVIFKRFKIYISNFFELPPLKNSLYRIETRAGEFYDPVT